MDVDGGSVYIPYPERQCHTNPKSEYSFFYDYYDDLSKIEGKLFKMMSSGSLQYDFSLMNTEIHLFLIFNNEQEQMAFNDFAFCNYDKIDMDLLRENPRVSLALSQVKAKDQIEEQVLSVAIASELYNLWLEQC